MSDAAPKPLWLTLLEAAQSLLTGLLTDQQLVEAGARPGTLKTALTTRLDLGSGYSVEAERAQKVMVLRAVCDKARSNPAWRPGQPDPGNTHCNGNADEVAQEFGYTRLAGLMADAQIAVLAVDPDWREDTAERFAAHVLKGGLAFATVIEHPHGHLCPGYPDPAQESQLWGALEPMVSNVGETVGVERLSDAFLLRQRALIRFYLYKPDEDA